LKPCPDEEGIKTNELQAIYQVCFPLKPCPDEEGIKTRGFMMLPRYVTLKPCPDEEGIKTDTAKSDAATD